MIARLPNSKVIYDITYTAAGPISFLALSIEVLDISKTNHFHWNGYKIKCIGGSVFVEQLQQEK